MPDVPTDPDNIPPFYTCLGAATALTALYDVLSEVQIFSLSGLWEEGSPEFHAAADTIEGIKIMVAMHQNKMVKKSQEYLE